MDTQRHAMEAEQDELQAHEMQTKGGEDSVPRTLPSPPSLHAPTLVNPTADDVVAVAAAMSRPSTPPPPADAPLAKDVAIDVNLPSRANSIDLHDGHRLVPVGAHEQVHPDHDIVKDRKTGKHYKKVLPPWSMAHAKHNNGSSSNHGQFTLGHSFGQRDPATAGSRPPSKAGSYGSRTPPLGVTSSLSAGDVAALVERLRVVVREEVSVANRGHVERIEKVVNEQFESNDGPEAGVPKDAHTAPTQYTTSEQSDISSKDGGKAVLDPLEAERGADGVSDADEYEFPNPWTKFRYTYREPLAEFLGCAILMTFGNGINIQALFSSDYDPSSPKGSYLSVSFGWGIAVAMAVYVCGGVSGHINPAVTISLAIFRKFPWKKVPGYIFAQLCGATLGALMIYGLYVNPIRVVDPLQTQKTAAYFTTFPADFITSPSTRISGFYNEVYATAVVLMVILAINDGSNTPPPDGLAPIVLLWLITGIGATLGWQTAYAVNPARDLGPRFALSIVGYRGLWTFDAWYWAYTPLLGPLVGGPLGCLIYDALIYTGSESPLNQPWKWSDIRWRPTSKKIPAGVSQDADKHA